MLLYLQFLCTWRVTVGVEELHTCVGVRNNTRNTYIFFFLFLVMGHVLASAFQIKNSLDVIQSLAAKQDITHRERLHVEAVNEFSAG